MYIFYTKERGINSDCVQRLFINLEYLGLIGIKASEAHSQRDYAGEKQIMQSTYFIIGIVGIISLIVPMPTMPSQTSKVSRSSVMSLGLT